jgi:hypothetical protein
MDEATLEPNGGVARLTSVFRQLTEALITGSF